MPLIESTDESHSSTQGYTELPFPPLTRSHILNCSYHSWYPRYRSLTPRARLIPLSPAFLAYLRADGIVLPPENTTPRHPDPLTPPPSESEASDWDGDDDDGPDPSESWRDIHSQVSESIKQLGGSVMPKLNWSAPKDATWINATNSMECRTANDVYLLLKSSDFVTHDLEQVWDGCEDASSDEEEEEDDDDDDDDDSGDNHEHSPGRDTTPHDERSHEPTTTTPSPSPSYHLILRKTLHPALNPALEFRCFVRARQLLCLCQRDLNHYPFLHSLLPRLRTLILDFFTQNLQRGFPDPDFVFDVYVPEGYKRVRLVDVNPWAARTDPLLFSWLEVLTMVESERVSAGRVRGEVVDGGENGEAGDGEDNHDDDDDEDDDVEEVYMPEFRLVGRDDPEAYAFNSSKYSAHKLPKDVVDAGVEGGEGIKEFLTQWRDIIKAQEKDDDDAEVES